MNRRELILGAGAVVAASALPSVVEAARIEPIRRLLLESGFVQHETFATSWMAIWTEDSHASRHAEVVRAWIDETVQSGYLKCGGETYILDKHVRLPQVDFTISPADKVWSHWSGWVEEAGLKVVVRVLASDPQVDATFDPVYLMKTRWQTDGTQAPEETRYLVRRPLLRYHEERELRYALGDTAGYSPNSLVEFDNGWLLDMAKSA
ncbi:putative TAT signal protein [Caulobacter virus Karma]|uniref:putative TAT signal protein n=1 Tax=Caulobacter virus Karma TaxID=1211641 RepID=UPI00028B7313|nr:putative TAT signal protein [Caulobacter virus Karma]AFU87789.1 putative TAT signal protein [Caulobacter virus Karma]